MQTTGVAIFATWQSFYVIIGSAAATLTGLMFIVVTLMSESRQRLSAAYIGISAFSEPTLVHFGAALLVAAFLNAPWQALWNVSIPLGIVGVGGVIYILVTVPQMRSLPDYRPSVSDWVWYFSFPLILYAGLFVSALLLPGNPVPALYAIGAITVLFLFNGLRNAWDLVIFLAIQRTRSEGEDRGQG